MIIDTKVCYDSHCHLSPDITNESYEEYVKPILESQSWPINLMMTNHIDKELIVSAINDINIMSNKQIMVNVGIHPWFTHLYTFYKVDEFENIDEFKLFHYKTVLERNSKKNINKNNNGDDLINDSEFKEILGCLPVPISIYETINEFKEIILKSEFSNRINIGEIGLDKLARIPKFGFLGNPIFNSSLNGGLSNFKVKMDHQIEIFKIQFELAINLSKMNKIPKKISIHCVNCHGKLFEIIKQFDSLSLTNNEIPAIVMHSYSGSIDNAKMLLNQLKHLHVWFGLSDVVNLNKPDNDKIIKLIEIIKDRLLIETDLGIDRMLDQHANYIEVIVKKLADCNINEITLLDNWRSFTQFAFHV